MRLPLCHCLKVMVVILSAFRVIPNQPHSPRANEWIVGVEGHFNVAGGGGMGSPKIIQRAKAWCLPAFPCQPQISLPKPAVVGEFADDVLRWEHVTQRRSGGLQPPLSRVRLTSR